MRFPPGIRRFFRLPPSPGRLEGEVRDEVRFHLDARVEDLVAEGVSPADAEHQARHEFGDPASARRELAALGRARLERARRREWWRDLAQDVRFAARSFRARPGFALAAGGTIAVGAASGVTLFAVARFILLEPLAYPDAGRLVAVWERGEPGHQIAVAGPNAFDWHAGNRTLDGMAIYRAGVITVLAEARAARIGAAEVSEDFARVFRLTPGEGRGFTTADFVPGATPVALVSDRFRRERWGSEPATGHRVLDVDGVSRIVVGVLPAGFHFPADADLWVPVGLASVVPGYSRTSHNWSVVARVRETETIAAARADLERIQAAIRREHGVGADAVGVLVRPLREELTGPVERPLLLLLGAAGLVLLLACTNVASMVLARGTARQAEFAVRSSLGAGRGRLVRQLWAESLLLSGVGTAAGFLAAILAVRGIVSLAPVLQIPRLADVRLDEWTALFGFAVVIGAAILIGLLPGLRLTGGRSVGGFGGVTAPGRSRQWSLLVVAEMALATMLAVGAGLLVRSFHGLMQVESGIDPQGVLVLESDLPSSRYPEDLDLIRALGDLRAELRAMPGIDETGLITHLPQAGWGLNGGLEVEGHPEGGYADYRVADAGYFRVFGIPVRRGRLFTEADDVHAPTVAVVNDAMADRYWPGQDPVGRRIRNLANDSFRYGGEEWITIVGVVGNVKDRSLAEPTDPTVYLAVGQRPMRARFAAIVARADGGPELHLPILRARLDAQFPDIAIRYQTMVARLNRTTAQRRFTLALFAGLAATALLLAMIGVHGVVSFRVEQQTREIGLRIALGAAPGDVRRLVVVSALAAASLGLGVGLGAALLAARLMASLLFGIPPSDSVTFLAVSVVLLAAALAASAVPAWRATRVDPLAAIRST